MYDYYVEFIKRLYKACLDGLGLHFLDRHRVHCLHLGLCVVVAMAVDHVPNVPKGADRPCCVHVKHQIYAKMRGRRRGARGAKPRMIWSDINWRGGEPCLWTRSVCGSDRI